LYATARCETYNLRFYTRERHYLHSTLHCFCSFPTPVTLYYTLDDIEQLDREGREADNCNSVVKEFLSLSQILRAIGSYVGRRGARLLSVSNNALTGTMPVVKIEYETAQGERVVDDRTGSAIYDMCVSIYKLRGRSRLRPLDFEMSA
jgi:hypothetical protein